MKTGSRFFRFYRKKRNSPPSAGLRTLSRGERGREGGRGKKEEKCNNNKEEAKQREREGRGEGKRRVRAFFGTRAKRVAVVAHISGA